MINRAPFYLQTCTHNTRTSPWLNCCNILAHTSANVYLSKMEAQHETNLNLQSKVCGVCGDKALGNHSIHKIQFACLSLKETTHSMANFSSLGSYDKAATVRRGAGCCFGSTPVGPILSAIHQRPSGQSGDTLAANGAPSTPEALSAVVLLDALSRKLIRLLCTTLN